MTSRRPQILFAMRPDVHERIFSGAWMARFEEIADVKGVVSDFDADASRRALATTDLMITGWGCPPLGDEVLESAPALEAIVHSGGTVKNLATDAIWARNVQIASSAAANALPVAEYTLAVILMSNKRVLPLAARYRKERRELAADVVFPEMGNYGKRIGIVGASKIGRKVIELLRPFGYEVVVYDPFLSADDAVRLGVLTMTLEELLSTSDIVSVHAPSLPSTHHLIDAAGIDRLRHGATLVNTARGEIVDQDALTRRIVDGEIFAVLDVTTPWVLAEDHPLYDSDRVLLTPHIAGSLGTELGRLAASVFDETRRFASGLPLQHAIVAAEMSFTA